MKLEWLIRDLYTVRAITSGLRVSMSLAQLMILFCMCVYVSYWSYYFSS